MITAETRDLVARLADLLRRERAALGEFLVVLADFDRRKAWRDLGHAGLFPFLHRELGLSKSAAFYRKTAAELIQQIPEVVEPLRDGRLCLTSVVELSKVLTPENLPDVLPRFFHCSKQEAKVVSAELAPDEAPARKTVVTALRPRPTRAPDGLVLVAAPRRGSVSPAETPSQTVLPEEPRSPEAAAPTNPPAAPAAAPALQLAPLPVPRPEIVPLTADLRRLHATVSRRFLEKLETARSALSHSHPGASPEAVLEVGLDLILDRDAKRKGLVARPRPAPAPAVRSVPPTRPVSPDHGSAHAPAAGPAPASATSSGALAPSADPRYVPAHVRRAVWRRDQGRCRWPLESGGECGSTLRLELDHIIPVALGGATTEQNLRVVCGWHNELAARQVLGDSVVDVFRRGAAHRTGGQERGLRRC